MTRDFEGDWRAEPLRVIAGLREGARNLDRFLSEAVRSARKQGVSWEEIGAAYGVSRQAAWERFSKD